MVEERSVAKGNTGKPPAPWTQSRDQRASMGLAGVREAARGGKKVRFTALLHHITPELLEQSFHALSQGAAPGVDGVTWRDYGEGFHERVQGCTGKYIPGHTGPSHQDGCSYPKPMAGRGRWELPHWRTKWFSKRW